MALTTHTISAEVEESADLYLLSLLVFMACSTANVTYNLCNQLDEWYLVALSNNKQANIQITA